LLKNGQLDESDFITSEDLVKEARELESRKSYVGIKPIRVALAMCAYILRGTRPKHKYPAPPMVEGEQPEEVFKALEKQK
jgi:hypothetical protein